MLPAAVDPLVHIVSLNNKQRTEVNMNQARIKTAAQWLVELLAREALRAALHWIFNILKQDG